MHDYNASLAAVDETMTLLEDYRAELQDVRAASAFALADKQRAVDRAVNRCAAELYGLRDGGSASHGTRSTVRRLRRKLAALKDLQRRCTLTSTRLLEAWNARCGTCDLLAAEGFADAGRYLQKLSHVVDAVPKSGGSAVRTVIVDSARYPQTAEHIRRAQNRGQPDVVTLDRSGAAARRSESLAGKPARSDFDRDEYPCALFAEGGAGADVAYLSASDNRGSGSAVQWQVRTLPDGTRIRIRII